MIKIYRTRAWESDSGTSTVVQFRTDVDPMVWVNGNIGWMPIGNTPKDEAKAEKFAEETAEGYGLVECSRERAEWWAGWGEDYPFDEEDDEEEDDDV